MRRHDAAGRVGDLRAAVGPEFSIGLSADVQLLADLPDVDAWHSGLAGLLPGGYLKGWRHAHAIGALHTLSNVIGVPAAGPRGPFAAAAQAETWQLGSVIDGWTRLRERLGKTCHGCERLGWGKPSGLLRRVEPPRLALADEVKAVLAVKPLAVGCGVEEQMFGAGIERCL